MTEHHDVRCDEWRETLTGRGEIIRCICPYIRAAVEAEVEPLVRVLERIQAGVLSPSTTAGQALVAHAARQKGAGK